MEFQCLIMRRKFKNVTFKSRKSPDDDVLGRAETGWAFERNCCSFFDLPALVRTALRPLVAQLMELRLQIKSIEKELLAWHRTSQESRRLETIPGVGFITATMGPLKLCAH